MIFINDLICLKFQLYYLVEKCQNVKLKIIVAINFSHSYSANFFPQEPEI